MAVFGQLEVRGEWVVGLFGVWWELPLKVVCMGETAAKWAAELSGWRWARSFLPLEVGWLVVNVL